MQERTEVRAQLGRCPYCHVEVVVSDTKQACPRCAAWHHASCWSEHGGCTVCPREAKPPQPGDGVTRCRVAGCGAKPQQAIPQLAGFCPPHARHRGLFLAGVATLGMIVFGIPAVMLLVSGEAWGPGGVLLTGALASTGGRLHYRRLVDRLG